MIGWLLGTRIGRIVVAVAAALMSALALIKIGEGRGELKRENKGLKKSLETSNRAREKRDEINKASPDDVIRRLDGWMRDDDKDV